MYRSIAYWLALGICALQVSCEQPASTDDSPIVLKPIERDGSHPPGIDLALLSDDPRFGYFEDNPIIVHGAGDNGPRMERRYFDSLLDATGTPVKYERLGSGTTFTNGKPSDFFKVAIGDGTEVILWINMYGSGHDPDVQPAPVGFYKKGG